MASHCQRAGMDRWDVGKQFLHVGVARAGPEKLWLPLDPWKCPRPGWVH